LLTLQKPVVAIAVLHVDAPTIAASQAVQLQAVLLLATPVAAMADAAELQAAQLQTATAVFRPLFLATAAKALWFQPLPQSALQSHQQLSSLVPTGKT